LEEKVNEQSIVVTGNTVIDALYWVVDKIKSDDNLSAELKGVLVKAGYDVERLDNSQFTIHNSQFAIYNKIEDNEETDIIGGYGCGMQLRTERLQRCFAARRGASGGSIVADDSRREGWSDEPILRCGARQGSWLEHCSKEKEDCGK
jgi:hypothetical protein